MIASLRVNLLGGALRWVKSARRENERRERDAPLFWFGGLVPKATASERERMYGPAAQAARAEADQVWHASVEARAAEARAILSLLLMPDELEAMDVQRRMYPSSSEYSATFWCGSLRGWFRMQPCSSEARS